MHYQGVSQTGLKILGKYGLTVSTKTLMKVLDNACGDFGSFIKTRKTEIQNVLKNNLQNPVNFTPRPRGFGIVGDNLDYRTSPRQISSDYKSSDYDFHYYATIAVDDVITGEVMDNTKERPNIKDIPIEDFYEWNPEEEGHMLCIARDLLIKSLNERFPNLFKDIDIISHITHQYSDLFSKPIEQHTHKLYFENENDTTGLKNIFSGTTKTRTFCPDHPH